jgi:hypothetical protein
MPHFALGVIDRGQWKSLGENVQEHPQQRPICLGEQSPRCRRQRVGGRSFACSAAEPGLSHEPVSLQGDQVRPHPVSVDPNACANSSMVRSLWRSRTATRSRVLAKNRSSRPPAAAVIPASVSASAYRLMSCMSIMSNEILTLGKSCSRLSLTEQPAAKSGRHESRTKRLQGIMEEKSDGS